MIGYNAYIKIMQQVNNRNKRGMLRIILINDGIEEIGYMATDGNYFIRYLPTNRHGEQLCKKIVINLDLGRKIRVNNWKEFIKISKEDPLYKFIIEYTNISEELMQMAIDNPLVRIPFCLDMIKIKQATIDKLKKQKKKVDEFGLLSTLDYSYRKKKLK